MLLQGINSLMGEESSSNHSGESFAKSTENHSNKYFIDRRRSKLILSLAKNHAKNLTENVKRERKLFIRNKEVKNISANVVSMLFLGVVPQ